MTFDSVLSRELTDLADQVAPACSVTVDRGISEGRRGVRNRQLAGVGAGAVAVVAAVAIGVPALAPAGHASPVSQGPAAGSAVPRFSGGSDPLTVAAAFGWLPAGLNTLQVGTQPGQPDQIEATGPDPAVDFDLSVYAEGQQVIPQHFKGGIVAPHTSAPSVDGHDAYWTFVPGSSESTLEGVADLVWEYAPDAWAVLEYDAPDIGTNSAETIYKVAESVTFSGPAAQPMPFHLQQPANLPVQDASVSSTARRLINAAVDFDIAQSPTHTGSGSRLTIVAAAPGHLDIPAGSDGTTTDITVDGHKAQLETASNFSRLSVYGVNGMDVEIQASGTELTSINASGGLVAYFHTITWLGLNSVNWTTSVVGGR